MRRGETKLRVLRTLVILGILAGTAGAVIGAAGAVSAWRQDAKRDRVARLIADARFVSSRERGVLASVETLPTSAERRAAAASFAPLASGQTRRLDRAFSLASGEPAARLVDAETQHARAVSLVSHAFAEGTPPAARLQLLKRAGTLLRSSEGSKSGEWIASRIERSLTVIGMVVPPRRTINLAVSPASNP